MDSSTMTSTVSLPTYYINYTGGTVSVAANTSRSHILTILTHTTAHPLAGVQNSEQGNKNGQSNSEEDDDSFGEHYFHICIYIWVCVVVSSLIALSVKWGCCGRSLTRWEVKRIPLKRFQRTEGEDGQEKCPICHEEFHEERLIRQLPCNHCYHSYCVDRWLVKMSNRCPLCKQRVSISLLCPWNKQRRKKEVNGQLTADLDASGDESPPLPPLSTLTPSNWYGEEIMSGPSKFIIMRPGRPTRVIDIREKKKTTAVPPNSTTVNQDLSTQPKIDENLCSSQNPGGIVHEQNCRADIWEISDITNEADNVPARNIFEADDALSADDEVPTACISRSCSITSDQPLLIQYPCNFEDETEPQFLDEQMSPEAGLTLCAEFGHSQDHSSNAKCCPSQPNCKYLQHFLCEPDSNLVHNCTCGQDHKNTHRLDSSTEATVTLSSRSSSVVSCSMRTSIAEPELLTPSTDAAYIVMKHSASTDLNLSGLLLNGRYSFPISHRKCQILPGKYNES